MRSSCQIPDPLAVAVDTNILLGLINREDRLHDDCVKLIKNADRLLISRVVLIETIGVFPKKAMEVLIDAFQFFLRSEKVDYDTLIEHLDKKRPRYNNFNRYVAKFALKSWEKHRDPYHVFEEVSKMLRELMEFDRITNFIAKKMDELDIVVDSEMYKINRSDDRDLELCENILDTLKSSSIKFRDNFDREIFIETVVYSAKTREPIVFVTDDREFLRKSNRAIETIDFLDLENLRFCLLDEVLQVLLK